MQIFFFNFTCKSAGCYDRQISVVRKPTEKKSNSVVRSSHAKQDIEEGSSDDSQISDRKHIRKHKSNSVSCDMDERQFEKRHFHSADVNDILIANSKSRFSEPRKIRSELHYVGNRNDKEGDPRKYNKKRHHRSISTSSCDESRKGRRMFREKGRKRKESVSSRSESRERLMSRHNNYRTESRKGRKMFRNKGSESGETLSGHNNHRKNDQQWEHRRRSSNSSLKNKI
jgi:hypothetical protein